MSKTEETIAEKRPHFGHGSSTTDIQSDAKMITKKNPLPRLDKIKKELSSQNLEQGIGGKKEQI